MIDPELKIHLEIIENELVLMRKKANNIWQIFWHGCISGAGYVVGTIIIILIVGWILNLVGIIPAFNRQMADFRTSLDNISKTVK